MKSQIGTMSAQDIRKELPSKELFSLSGMSIRGGVPLRLFNIFVVLGIASAS